MIETSHLIDTPIIGGDGADRPFTLPEKLRIYSIIVLIPLAIVPFLVLGAFLRTFPSFPPLWPGFWSFEASLMISYLISVSLLIEYPRIIRLRASKIIPDNKDSAEERRFHDVTSALFIPGFFLMPWDAVGRRTEFPILLNLLGSLCIIGSAVWIALVFRSNQYASRVVCRQQDQKLIQDGPYSIVRHPMYMGLIPFFLGMPLSLGSYWGLIPMLILEFMMAYRTYAEERFLVETFGEDYEQYRQRVTFKMVPFVF